MRRNGKYLVYHRNHSYMLHLETLQLNLGQTLCVVHEIALYCSLY